MKTNKFLLLILMSALAINFYSCTDLDTFPESGTITSDQKKDIAEAMPERLAADISGMYSILGAQYAVFGSESARHDDFGYPAVCMSWDANGPDFVTDESNYNWFSTCSAYEDRTYNYANPLMRWRLFYMQMKLANDVLASIPVDTDLEVLKHYMGQAYAIRAFDYLNLAPYFQFKYKGNEQEPSIPIVTWDMTGDLSSIPRATQKEVYELIMDDLDNAIELLDGFTRTSKGQIDQQIAYGLRARANLYMENWAAAAADAEMALTGYQPYSRDDVSEPTFVYSDDPNWMWALVIDPANVPGALATWPSKMGSFTGNGYSTGAACFKMVNKLLWNMIPATDVRKGWWVDENLESPNLANVTWGAYTGNDIPTSGVDGTAKWLPYTNLKFGQYGGPGSTTNANDWPMMRAEEMYLILAEAKGMINEADGKTILQDFVSTYRDPDYDVNANGLTFRNEVWFQRRVELWGEGFAMADIMRLGKPVVRFSSTKPSNFPGIFEFNLLASDPWLLNRIPQAEMNSNAGIVQNEGGTLPVSGQNPTITDGVTD
ncbi:MAG: RagB/SusD family nutrient uptake outer membrane protein [Bacteroidales bacterium]|nr:RagB/SusD family nutrient uptake outer membrane protein [Bacteroidales bacterium]MDY0347895.1 RagB/SusD family nutrient uptake outer membrane protein [Tenuifilaceae bacterium]